MARPRYPKSTAPLPPPLPPVSRTVGQLVAETLKVYGEHWKAALVIGAPVALLNVLATGLTTEQGLVIIPFVGAIAATTSFVIACAVVGWR